jgi:hypothetical protein
MSFSFSQLQVVLHLLQAMVVGCSRWIVAEILAKYSRDFLFSVKAPFERLHRTKSVDFASVQHRKYVQQQFILLAYGNEKLVRRRI